MHKGMGGRGCWGKKAFTCARLSANWGLSPASERHALGLVLFACCALFGFGWFRCCFFPCTGAGRRVGREGGREGGEWGSNGRRGEKRQDQRALRRSQRSRATASKGWGRHRGGGSFIGALRRNKRVCAHACSALLLVLAAACARGGGGGGRGEGGGVGWPGNVLPWNERSGKREPLQFFFRAGGETFARY